MRIGDYVLGISMVLNVAAGVAYAWQGHWRNVGYWFAVLQHQLLADADAVRA